ncbi:early nodulin-like protein 20 [Mercurialis annua]|uniref:early nodulin-like protein 20 n=1 Tax=Mercurialis annua TaxID=3986 RepID=UPI00215FC407|nr:early nodulin-like protein 20 [Mercurialis annua]
MESKIIMVMVMMMVVMKGAECRLIKIGGRGWIPNYNYTQWLNQHHDQFYVGDWLLFVFDKHYFNVLEVNKTSYENCNDQGFILNITRGGRDVYQLKEARPYYFLSSGGYCWNGMKLAISVQQFSPSTTPVSSPPSINGSPHNNSSRIILVSVSFYVALFWVNFFKP